jgi:ankyrin repeat protein
MSIDDKFVSRINNMNSLFQFVRSNRETELMEFLNNITSSDIDLSYKDPRGNYLIYLVIVKGFTKIVSKLIDYGAPLDVLDSDGTSILHYPIKYDQDEILTMLLDASERTIGISLVNIPDNNKRIPINYAVNYQNIFALTELIKRGANINYALPDGLIPLHMATIKKNLAIARILIRHGTNINAQKKSGITPLHIASNLLHPEMVELLLESGANQYLVENSYGFSPIYYAVIQSDQQITKIFFDHGFDINFTDNIGNGIIYYSLVKKDFSMIRFYFDSFLIGKQRRITNQIPKSINANQTNIKGETLAHIFLDNYEESYREILVNLIDKTDLGLQDEKGDTVLHQIARQDRWQIFEAVLRKKKLGIYVLNNNNESPYSLTKKYSRQYLIEIVADSYFEYLRMNHDKAVGWELKCIENVKQKIPEYCQEKAREMILARKLPYPIAKNILDPYHEVTFTTFHSKSLDVLSGFSYICSIHKHINFAAIVGDHNPPELESYYKMLGLITDPYNSFIQFEIKWIFQKLFLPYKFKEILTSMIQKSNQSLRYIVAPIGIKLQTGSHSNGLIIDLSNIENDQVTIERFEPHGSAFPRDFNYNPDLLDDILSSRIGNIIVDALGKSIKLFYVSPKDYLPRFSFQAVESNEENNENIGDPGGFCAIWTIWYLDHRVRYTNLSQLVRKRQLGGATTQEDSSKLPSKIVQRLIDAIRISQIPFRSTIRAYSKKITDYRDRILSEFNYNINDYINKKIPLNTLHLIAGKMITNIKEN